MSLSLRIEDLRKSYARPVLGGINYQFMPDRVYALMGPNGAGKSTLFRLLALLEKPDHGRVIYENGPVDILDDMNLRRRITLLLPESGLFNTTVLANAAYGLRLRGVGRAEAKRLAVEALASVGLEHKADQRALTLSSGESQRLALARAIAIRPEVFFLDEPTASLDPENREIIEEALLSMRGRTGIILSTHDRTQAEKLGDVILMLKDGKLSEEG